MASSLRLITSNLVTRSFVRPFRPSVVVSSATRFLSTVDAPPSNYTSISSLPTNDFFDQSWVRNMFPKTSTMSFVMTMNYEHTGLALCNNEGNVFMEIPGPEIEDVCWLRKGENNKECFFAGINLADYKSKSVTKEDNEDESMNNIMANIAVNIITSFRDITAKGSWPYYDMFHDTTILGKAFRSVTAMLPQINSFTIYKEETDQGLSITVDMPRNEKMDSTTQGLCVSLDMRKRDREKERLREPEREDVKTFFDYDTFFIEVRTNKEHYIKGIHLPEGDHKKNSVIKKWLKDGVFYAFLPSLSKKGRNQYQLKLIA